MKLAFGVRCLLRKLFLGRFGVGGRHVDWCLRAPQVSGCGGLGVRVTSSENPDIESSVLEVKALDASSTLEQQLQCSVKNPAYPISPRMFLICGCKDSLRILA